MPTNHLRRLFTHLHVRELKEWMLHCCGVCHSSHTALLIRGSLVYELFFPCSRRVLVSFTHCRLWFPMQCGFCCRLPWFSSVVHCPVISHCWIVDEIFWIVLWATFLSFMHRLRVGLFPFSGLYIFLQRLQWIFFAVGSEFLVGCQWPWLLDCVFPCKSLKSCLVACM